MWCTWRVWLWKCLMSHDITQETCTETIWHCRPVTVPSYLFLSLFAQRRFAKSHKLPRLLRTCRDPVCFGGRQNNDIWWWGCTACCPFKLLHKSAMGTDYFYICYFPHLIRSAIEEEAAKAFREIQRVTFKVYIKTSGLLFREDWWAIECLNRCTGYLYDSAHANLWLLSLHSKGV